MVTRPNDSSDAEPVESPDPTAPNEATTSTAVSASIEIDRPVHEVFSFIANMSNNPLWQKGQVSCVWTTPMPIRVGSTYLQHALVMGRSVESSFEVVEFELNRRIRVKSTSGPIPVEVTRTVDASPTGGTTVTATVIGQPSGLMSTFGGPIARVVARSIRQDYARLKRAMESEIDPTPNHLVAHNHSNVVFGYASALTTVVGRQHDADLVADLTTRLGPGVQVLDIGCGTGAAVRTAARTGAHATGIDPSVPMLNAAQWLTQVNEPEGRVIWHEAEAENMPVPGASVDACWSINSIHHWTLLDRGLREVARVLKPGGQFIALEKRSPRGATGSDRHGWTQEQAGAFVEMMNAEGLFRSVDVRQHLSGSTPVITVTAHRSHREVPQTTSVPYSVSSHNLTQPDSTSSSAVS